MVNVFGRVGTKNDKYIKVAEIEDPLEFLPDLPIDNPCLFSGKYKADDDETYYVDLSENEQILEKYIQAAVSSADIPVITKQDFPVLNAIYVIDENGNIKFQRVWTRYYFKKGFLGFNESSVCKIKQNDTIITLTGNTDAYYDANGKRLYFKNFMTIKTIFPGIEMFYREATAEDVNNFKAFPIIDFDDTGVKLSDTSRRKIADMIDSGVLNDSNLSALQSYATKYNQSLSVDNDKIKISCDSDIRLLYKLANEMFYTTDISHKRRESNSVKDVA